MKRDDEFRTGFQAGWLHGGGTGKPDMPSTPILRLGENYYAEGFERGAHSGRALIVVPIAVATS